MVDVQEQGTEGRKPNGKTIKRRLLHSLDGKFVTLDSGGEAIYGICKYEAPRKGVVPGNYIGGRHITVSEVHGVYPDQNRIELYSGGRT